MGIKQMKISDTCTLYFWHFAILSGKKKDILSENACKSLRRKIFCVLQSRRQLRE